MSAVRPGPCKSTATVALSAVVRSHGGVPSDDVVEAHCLERTLQRELMEAVVGNEGKFGSLGGQEIQGGIATPDVRLGEVDGGNEIHGGAAVIDERFNDLQGDKGQIHGGARPRNPSMGDVSELREAEAGHEQRRAKTAIEQKYRDVGGMRSGLGLTIDEPSLQADGTYLMNTRGGHVSWTPDSGDTKAVVTNVAKIVYRGLKCFGTQRGGKDEAYAVISIVQPDQYVADNQILVASERAPKTGTYTDVADGSMNTAGLQEFFADAPQDIIIHAAVMEHDEGDPEAVRQAIKKAVQDGANAAAAAVSGGAATTVPMDPSTLQGMFVNWMAGAFVSLLGPGDDLLGDGSFLIKHKDWATGNFPPMLHRDGVDYNYKQYCTNGDASYDVMFEVSVMKVYHEL